MKIHEKGKTFKETIVIDTQKGTQTAYVPQHGKISAAKYIYDFNRVSIVFIDVFSLDSVNPC